MVKITQLNENNTELLANLDEDIFDEKIDFDRVAAYVKEQNHIFLVAIKEGIVIGQVLAVIHRHPDKPTELYIDDLAVSEQFQRQGIAKRMLNELFAIGKKRGCEEIWVATEPKNEQAKGFYASMNLSVRTAFVFEGEL